METDSSRDLMTGCKIVTFDARYRYDFARLNYAWITALFAIEPPDQRILDHPETEIIERGGEIFFALKDERVVGTVALKAESQVASVAKTFELTKMAVDETERGHGYGRALLEVAIAHARSRGAKHIVLSSHSKLLAAIAMYRNAGFVERNEASNSCYSRCNIFMRKDL